MSLVAVSLPLNSRLMDKSLSDLKGKSGMTGDKILVDVSVDDCVHVFGN